MNVICLGVFSTLIVKNVLFPDLQEMLFYSYLMMVYFIVDIIWLFRWPECNPCPYDVIFHHILCMVALCVNIKVPESRHIGAKVQLIELTTWLQHLRRLMKPKKYRVLDNFNVILLMVIRHLWFPYLAYSLIFRWSEAFYVKFCLAGVLYLNIMYIKWTVRHTVPAYLKERCKKD